MEFDISTYDLLEKCLREILHKIPPNACFTLSGHPGAGKTTLVKTAARILGVTDNVQSPTFNILNVYTGYSLNEKPVEVYHYDFYRLSGKDHVFDLQLPHPDDKSYFYVFMEWPEKVDINNIISDIDVYGLTIDTKYSPETNETTERKLIIDF